MVVNTGGKDPPKSVRVKINAGFDDPDLRARVQHNLYFNRKRRRGLAGIPVVDVPFNPPDSPNPKSAFDQLYVAQGTDPLQITWPYNVNPDQGRIQETNLGTVTQANSQLVVQSGAAADSSAEYLSIRLLQYRPGQGIDVRSGCTFSPGQPGSEQLIGLGDDMNGYYFGYDGTTFSVLRRHGGVQEVRLLTIDTSPTSSGNISIVIPGNSFDVGIEAGDTTQDVARKIDSAAKLLPLEGWRTDYKNSVVEFFAWVPEVKIGTVDLNDIGGTGAAGTGSTFLDGQAATDQWIPQSAWNRDTMDGKGPSKAVLDPTKGNEYRIVSPQLSYNHIDFWMLNPVGGADVLVHRLHYLNLFDEPAIDRSGLPMKIVSRNFANTSNLTVRSTSLSCFVQGFSNNFLPFKSADTIENAAGGTEGPLITIRNNTTHQGIENRSTVKPQVLSVSTSDTQGVVFRVYANAQLEGPVNFVDVNPETSVVSVDVDATGFSGGEFVFSIQLGGGGEEIVGLPTIRGLLLPGVTLTVTVEASSGNNINSGASYVWQEEQ